MPPGVSRRRPPSLLLLLLLCAACVGGALATDAQGAALLAWKLTLRGGGAAESLGDWQESDASPCRWTGVSCNSAGGVTELSLQYVDLHGGVPDDLSAVSATLSRLVLTGTNLSGPIPPHLGDQLPALTHLDLSNNALTGPIPTSLCRPGSKLESLHLNSNHLEGAIPISGPLPATLGRLKNLDTIAIYTALLSGPIPPELGQCTNLENIYLYENALSGSIPPQLGKLSNLKSLLLWQNNLVGVIPPELGACAWNHGAGFIHERVDGPHPGVAGQPDGAGGAAAEREQGISGAIPAEIGKLASLRMLYLWANQLTGSIPAEMGGCASLESLDLSETAPSLVRFRASGNHLAGNIPPQVGRLTSLSFLDLGSNRLSGSIPPELAACRNLTFVDLHGNAIAGAIPRGCSATCPHPCSTSTSPTTPSPAPSLQISGGLASLTKLVLAGNRLSGPIPPEIGSCSRLQLLDLGGNALSGAIPPTIGKIPGLEIALNLSCNALIRSHPQGPLSALQNLVALNISFNDFAGRRARHGILREAPRERRGGGQPGAVRAVALPGRRGPRPYRARRAARIATAVLLSALVALLAAAAFLLLSRLRSWRSKQGGGGSVFGGEDDKDAEMLPPWDVTLYQKLEISVGDVARSLTPANVIGQGWSGSVYRASVPSSSSSGNGGGVTIAVKKFRSRDEAAAEAFACEVGVLPRVRHRNVVRLLGWAAKPPHAAPLLRLPPQRHPRRPAPRQRQRRRRRGGGAGVGAAALDRRGRRRGPRVPPPRLRAGGHPP
ncbi:hypothetical protein PR202_gb26298 [Eleusine coracana subsp. coracana]|uniref:Protein kinase domain-containing protein n=1 Tax=Eleusine coracana subsp. coracana TaxID=191504 RepID=A0AAV5FRH1_ELECO|nr:hypothetical protein PR202_gb26298 [Eleusine coracana subsp. coracana]